MLTVAKLKYQGSENQNSVENFLTKIPVHWTGFACICRRDCMGENQGLSIFLTCKLTWLCLFWQQAKNKSLSFKKENFCLKPINYLFREGLCIADSFRRWIPALQNHMWNILFQLFAYLGKVSALQKFLGSELLIANSHVKYSFN